MMAEGKQTVKRKPSFSDSEIRSLIELFDSKKEILLSKFNHAVTKQRKQAIWREITTAVNARAISGFSLSLKIRSLRTARRAFTACIKNTMRAILKCRRTCKRQTNVRFTPTSH